MPAHDDPPTIGPAAAVFVCACGVRVEVDDPAHLRVVEALHAAGGCGVPIPEHEGPGQPGETVGERAGLIGRETSYVADGARPAGD